MLGMLVGAQKKRSAVRSVRKDAKRIRIICVDDHRIFLSRLLSYVGELMPEAETVGFENPEEAISFAKEVGCDILFTEIELGGKPSGLLLARQIQEANPRVNLIFTTVCSPNEYAKEVMEIRPSGYLTKVVEMGEVEKALQSLLYAV